MTSRNPSDHDASAHGDDRRRLLGHDLAGHAYPTAATPKGADGRLLQPGEPVASRSTDDEARDLLAVRRAKRGDTGAFADLIRANDADVRSLLAALVGDDQIDTVCRQVYLRAFRGLPLAPTTSPRLWLLGIADGAARDIVRRIRQHPAEAARSAAPIPLDAPSEERLVLAAVEAAGLTPRETARIIGGGVEHVRDLLASGRQRPGVTLPFDPPSEHGPRFWDDLGRRLLIEQSAPAASRPKPGTVATPGHADTETTFADERSMDVARGMAVRVEQQNPRVFPWRKVVTATAAAVTVIALIGVALMVAGHASRRDAGLGETAAKTLNRLDAALAHDTVVRGRVRITTAEPGSIPSGTFLFVRSNTGSWRLTATDGSVDEGYDVSEANATTIRRPTGGGAASATVRTGLAPGPPEATGVALATPGDLLGNVIRIVRAGSSGTVENRSEPAPTTGSTTATTTGPTTTEGRPIWVVTSRLDDPVASGVLAGSGDMGEIRADEAELIADQSLALPTRLTLRRNGRRVATVQFSALSISQQAATSSYAPPVRPGVQTTTKAGGFTTVEAGELTGNGIAAPPTPSYLPGGYVLAASGVDRARKTTVLCYRNGSRQLVLTRRVVPPGKPAAADPFTTNKTEPDHTTIDSGVLSGRDVYSAADPITHVWANGPRTQVIAAGDPPVTQLIKVVASLR